MRVKTTASCAALFRSRPNTPFRINRFSEKKLKTILVAWNLRFWSHLPRAWVTKIVEERRRCKRLQLRPAKQRLKMQNSFFVRLSDRYLDPRQPKIRRIRRKCTHRRKSAEKIWLSRISAEFQPEISRQKSTKIRLSIILVGLIFFKTFRIFATSVYD